MSFRFYPTLDSRHELRKSINVVPTDDYHFLKSNEFGVKELSVSSGRIKDTLWDQARDSLIVRRDFKINDPDLLYGENGIACENAELGLCILWTNNDTSMAGCILPQVGTENRGKNGWSVFFQHTFAPGEIRGLLELKIVLYLKKTAETVLPGEEILNNKAGVILGDLEVYRLQTSDETIPFPFIVENSKSSALWWVDFYSWDDPAEDALFGPSSFVVTLNSSCKGCPRITEKGIQNLEMMYEIAASVYAMLFKKLTLQQFQEMRMRAGLPGTISAELKRIYDSCVEKFDYHDDYERIHKCIQAVIRDQASKATDVEEV